MKETRDLVREPAWRMEDLGKALPDSPHACSVCLPTWESVRGYEEGEEAVVSRLKLGYPRFFLNPYIEQLCDEARGWFSLNRSFCLPFPSREVAGRAQRFVERQTGQAGRLETHEEVTFLVVPQGESAIEARNYWRYTGEILSSRQAADLIEGRGALKGNSAQALRMKLAELHGGSPGDHFLFPSGMAALFAAHHGVMRLGRSKPSLQLEFPYTDLFNIQANFGSGVEFPNLLKQGEFERQLERIREGAYSAVFTELPSNPLCRCVDLEPLSRACREGNIPLVVDDTVASFINLDLRPYADVVTTSLTKWHAAEGDVMAGQVWINPDGENYEFFLEQMGEREDQCALYEGDARVLLGRLDGIKERVRHASKSARQLFEMLSSDPRVGTVWYPMVSTPQAYERVRRKEGEFGALISFVLRDRAKSAQFYDALRVSKGPSLGTNFSLVCPYTMLAHYDQLEWASERGVDADLIRVSVGQEETSDLVERFREALGSI